MRVSEPEVTLATCAADVIELAASRAHSAELAAVLAQHSLTLPACGALTRTGAGLALSYRPERWLLLSARAAPGAARAQWHAACAPHAAVIEQSSALAALHLGGAGARAMLTRGCRLDLDPALFPVGRVAATIIAQVATLLAALPSGILILTPASTARHLREWLAATAHSLAAAPPGELPLSALIGDPHS